MWKGRISVALWTVVLMTTSLVGRWVRIPARELLAWAFLLDRAQRLGVTPDDPDER